jgi:hypothetical protein
MEVPGLSEKDVIKCTKYQKYSAADTDPVPFDSWIRDPGSGMGKNSESGSVMNNPDHISECLETIFWG